MKTEKVPVTCPRCGHTQLEPPAAYSTVCKKCRQYFRLEELRQPEPPSAHTQATPSRDSRRVACFSCGTELDVPLTAQSTMCKRCSSHIDLRDYQITSTVSKNFKTKGRFVLEETGYLLNTDTWAGELVLKGKVRGKVAADTLSIYPTAEIKGSFKAARLIIPAVTNFRWPETIAVNTAEIAGELVGNLQAAGTVVLKGSARFFGDVSAAAIMVESGAVWVGKARIGPLKEPLEGVVTPRAKTAAQ
jgi:cytoskeletal protein CcmA (bactofilin family)/DNA-directed RNA polymerase subunit RPC12/RpoP